MTEARRGMVGGLAALAAVGVLIDLVPGARSGPCSTGTPATRAGGAARRR